MKNEDDLCVFSFSVTHLLRNMFGKSEERGILQGKDSTTEHNLNSLVVRQARLYTESQKNATATRRRTEIFHALGHFGVALFSPLDSAYDLDMKFLSSKELEKAELYSEDAKTEVAARRRTNYFHLLGDFGVALFSPLDAAFDVDSNLLFSLQKDKAFISQDITSNRRRRSLIGYFLTFYPDRDIENALSSTSDDCESFLPEDDLFDPVLIKSEPLEVLLESPMILKPEHMEELVRGALPFSFRYKTWVRLFSVSRDGDSMGTFLDKVKNHKHNILVIRTFKDEILGGFVDSTWKPQPHQLRPGFFGGGECFLYKVNDIDSNKIVSDRQPSKHNAVVYETYSQHEESRFSDNARNLLSIYKWTNANDYNQYLDHSENYERLAIGGGGKSGSFGLCVEDCFTRGTTGACDTFGNPPLVNNNAAVASTRESCFEIIEMEVFGFEI